ncbi:oxidoreductase [Nocardia mangyaensis]|uniref:Oxidoreductase n=1 Tax=Nocardia mangyaensis TaxID=2213200 RepID=A0A1J0VS20_9NOCA|nr:PDR/VanB family oxidoreductase [Nocardia mangyaensis]APE34810.1 oxidoreductase [Nocardia mangyaensis]
MTTAGPNELPLRVTGLRTLCEGIREVTLGLAGDGVLPSFAPGSHLAVGWADGERNSYSLTGPMVEPRHYSISVRHDRAGRGGSAWVHSLRVGDDVVASRPRSAFAPVADARHHVLVAGGIGVTPIVSHVRAAVMWQRSFEVVYVHRPGADAHAEDLRALARDRLTILRSGPELLAHMKARLFDVPLGAHLYVCGPEGLIEAVTSAALDAGWHRQRLHAEPFASAAAAGGAPFAARLGRSGALVPVGAETSLLEALLARGIAVPNLCRQGVCGECKLTVRGGGIDHRDTYLTDDERAAGDAMMPCVSRAVGDRVELEL